jgi:NAD+ synthase (glutamine-hydrolysing)
VLEAYVELDSSREDLTTDGFDAEVVERALGMIDRAEYKRRQAPPGVKLRPKAFGRDRRIPITNRWRG